MEEGSADVTRTIPWFPKFLRLALGSTETKDVRLLGNLVLMLLRLLSRDMERCYRRPESAAQLKSVVAQMLVYFNMFSEDVELQTSEGSIYLGLMSDLVAVYLDLEIKASKLGVESLKAIGHRMTSALYTFLDHSEAHVAETILKARLMTKTNQELCAPVLSKFLKEARCSPARESDYMRFLLAFKLWKAMRTDPEERRKIDEVAASKLSPPPGVLDCVSQLRGPTGVQENVTSLLMSSKVDFAKSRREFLSVTRRSRACDDALAEGLLLMADVLSDSLPDESQEKECLDPEATTSQPVRGAEDEVQGVTGELTGEDPRSPVGALVGGGCQPFASVSEKCEEGPGGTGDSPGAGSRSEEAVKFESVAQRFRVVKSSRLRRSAEKPPGKQVKGFEFSSKLVRITEEELAGNRPRRTRDWKGRRSGKKRLERAARPEDVDRGPGRTVFHPVGASPPSAGVSGWLGDSHADKDLADFLSFEYPDCDLLRPPAEDATGARLAAGGCDAFDFRGDATFLACGGNEGVPLGVPDGPGFQPSE